MEVYFNEIHKAWLASTFPRGPYGVPSIINTGHGRYIECCVGPGLEDITLHSEEEAKRYILLCDTGQFKVSHKG